MFREPQQDLCIRAPQLHNKIRDVAAGRTDRTTIESSMPSLTKTPSGRTNLLSLGSLGRSSTLRGIVDMHEQVGA